MNIDRNKNPKEDNASSKPKSGATKAFRACFGHQDHPTAGRAIEHRPGRLAPIIRKAYALVSENAGIEAKV